MIAIPSMGEQQVIVKNLSNIDSKILYEENKFNTLKNLKQGLMQQLLTGKVRISNNEDEEVPT
jgi:type I restriction enzyme S subunit